jgi:hypothetical protein
MTSIEDRLTAAMQAAAANVPDGPVAPLRLPHGRFRIAVPRLRGRVLTLVAPLAAATAMAAIITAAAIAHNDAAQRMPIGPAAVLRILPPYDVALTYVGQFKSWKIRRTQAVVASTQTGRRIATITPPAPYNAFVAVTGSADGRTYVLAAQQLTRTWRQYSPTRFYELRVSHGAATLRPLAIVLHHELPTYLPRSIALSQDGTRLAIAETWPTRSGQALAGSAVGVRIYDLATGALQHSWPVLPPPPPGKCCVFGPTAATPSWEANGRYLAIEVSLAHCSHCVALLDTSAAGRSVQAISKVIVRTHNRHYQEDWTNTIITPDGSRVIRSALVGVKVTRYTSYDVPHIFRYSVASDEATWSMRGNRRAGWTVVWSSQNGHSIVVARSYEYDPRPTGFITAAIFQAGRWTRVPLPAKTVAVAW